MSDANVPAGWYPDGSGGQRWWDGTRWTEHTQAPAGSPGPSAPVGGSSYEQVRQGYGATTPDQPDQPGQPGEPGPATRSKLPFVVGGVVAAVIVLALVLVFALSGGGAKPEATVSKAFAALQSGDCDGFRSTLTQDSEGRDLDCEAFQQSARLAEDLDVRILSTEVDGDEATVRAETSGEFAGRTRTQDCDIDLDREGGDWRIEDIDCD